jgi:hypothetical protein
MVYIVQQIGQGPSMASLKTLIPELAHALDMKEASIYERQRALTRAGLLEMRPGRGPGSGVLATPESLAFLLISLTVPNLSEVERQTKALAILKTRRKRCSLTGKGTFVSALAAVLQSEKLATRTSFFMVERGGPEFDATIAFDSKPGDEVGLEGSQLSRFGKDKARESPLYTQTYLALNFADVVRVLGQRMQ